MKTTIIKKISGKNELLGKNVFFTEDFEHILETLQKISDETDLEEYTNGECYIQLPTLALRNLIDYYKYRK